MRTDLVQRGWPPDAGVVLVVAEAGFAKLRRQSTEDSDPTYRYQWCDLYECDFVST